MNGLPPFLQHLLVDAFRLTLWLLLFAAILVPLERVTGVRPTGRRSPLVGEIGYYFLNNLLPNAVMAIPLAFVAAAARQLLPGAWLSLVAAMPFAGRLVVSLILAELVGYWAHRWAHEWPILWQFHARHHQPDQVNWLTNTHAHPIDMVWTHMLPLIPIYALGFADPVAGGGNLVAIFVALFLGFWSFFIHANVRWRLGLIEHIISTPAFHHWHHTNDQWRDHNYAALLPVMDRLFGTHHLPNRLPDRYGIDNPADVAPLLPLPRRSNRRRAKFDLS